MRWEALTIPLAVSEGGCHGGTALLLGAILLQKAWLLMRNPSQRQLARSLFKFSILYLMLLCAGLVVDTFPISHQLTGAIGDRLQPFIDAMS